MEQGSPIFPYEFLALAVAAAGVPRGRPLVAGSRPKPGFQGAGPLWLVAGGPGGRSLAGPNVILLGATA